jgi:hypothetical protein
LAVSLVIGLFLIYAALAGDAGSPPMSLFGLFFVAGGILLQIGDLLYERRRTLAQAVRIAGLLLLHAGFVALILWMWLNGDWGWFWYAASVYTLLMLAAVWHVVGKHRFEPS